MKKKRINSNQKGKRGERAWRDELIKHGYAARRGQQFAGSPDSPDVVCEQLSQFHFEVKTEERLNIDKAMEQASSDCDHQMSCPIVAHRRKRGLWLVTMISDDWFDLLKELTLLREYRTEASAEILRLNILAQEPKPKIPPRRDIAVAEKVVIHAETVEPKPKNG